MKFKSMMRVLQKDGLQAIRDTQMPNKYWVQGVKVYGTFIVQNDYVICVHTCPTGQYPDTQIGYFPGSYHTTLKRFIESLKRS